MKKRISVFVLFFVLAAPGILLRASSSGSESPRRVEITARRFAFDPNVITLKRGQPVLLVLKSADVPHGLRFRDLGVEIKAPKGGSSQVQFTPDKEGDFVGHCYVFCGAGHGSMSLTLHVVS
jgi:cytochrome c oxidase subunit 2